jgi:hypothetical protein
MDDEATAPPYQARRHDRRAEDPRIQTLIDDVAETKKVQQLNALAIAENTKLTSEMKGTVDEVKDILTSFRVLAKVAKWISSMAAAGAAIWAAWRQVRGG